MKRKYFLQLIILFLGFMFHIENAVAALNVQTAQRWAEDKGREIIEILTSEDIEQKYTDLDTILENDVDLDYAAKFVVGKYWRLMTPEQQQHYVPLFKRYVSALYKTYPLNLDKGAVRYTVDKALTDKNTVMVYCTIFIEKLEQALDKSSQGGIKVQFILSENRNRIQVRDLKIEERSLLVSYRERFYKMIHENNDDEIEWFLDDLAEIVDSAEAQNP